MQATIKQLEALYWIATLGTFDRAAMKLNTSQSAISKRINELEQATGVTIFDRSKRGAKLTDKGEHLVVMARQMLDLTERIAGLRTDMTEPARRLRLGVTELTAMTWLPRLVKSLQSNYPNLQLDTEVDVSRRLYDRLRKEEDIDLVIIPEISTDPSLNSVKLTSIQNVWMASPSLVKGRNLTSYNDFSDYVILSQGANSGGAMMINGWLNSHGFTFGKSIVMDSLNAVVGLAVAGIGIAHLPLDCFRPLVREKKLKVLPIEPALPSMQYVAMYRNDRSYSITGLVAELAQQLCDFSSQYQH